MILIGEKLRDYRFHETLTMSRIDVMPSDCRSRVTQSGNRFHETLSASQTREMLILNLIDEKLIESHSDGMQNASLIHERRSGCRFHVTAT